MKTIIRTIALVLTGGVVIAVVLSMLTVRSFNWTGPIGRPIATDLVEDWGGTDPWTGEYRDRTWTYTDANGLRVTRILETGDGYTGSIPLPIGFVVGSLLTLSVISMAAWALNRPASTPPFAGRPSGTAP